MNWGMFFNLFSLAVLWGSAFPLIKLGLSGMSAANLTLLRFLVASLCFVPYLILTQKRLFPDWRDVPTFLLAGSLGITVYHLALNYGELYVSAGAASLIIATAPALTAIVAAFVLRDRLPPLGWLGIGGSFAGVLLITLGDSAGLSLNPYGLLLLLSAFATALFTVVQKPLYTRYRVVEVTAYATWAGTLPLLIFLPWFFGDVADAGVIPLIAGVYLGIFPAAIAYVQFSYAISKLPVTLATSFLYSVPVFSLLFSWLILGEVPSLLTLVGGAAALIGIAVVTYAKRRERAVARALGKRI